MECVLESFSYPWQCLIWCLLWCLFQHSCSINTPWGEQVNRPKQGKGSYRIYGALRCPWTPSPKPRYRGLLLKLKCPLLPAFSSFWILLWSCVTCSLKLSLSFPGRISSILLLCFLFQPIDPGVSYSCTTMHHAPWTTAPIWLRTDLVSSPSFRNYQLWILKSLLRISTSSWG